MATDSVLNYGPTMDQLSPGSTSVSDGSGNTTYFDANGNALFTSNDTPNWDTTPTVPGDPVDSGGGTDLSTIGTFFAQMASGVASIVRSATGQSAPVCPSTLPCAAPNKPGYLYNPKTGQYTPQTSGFSLSSLTAGNGLLILVGIAVAIFFFARK
jgi:hypothetical protein